jgi:hypothetical protein
VSAQSPTIFVCASAKFVRTRPNLSTHTFHTRPHTFCTHLHTVYTRPEALEDLNLATPNY